jgi:hypothetical protein
VPESAAAVTITHQPLAAGCGDLVAGLLVLLVAAPLAGLGTGLGTGTGVGDSTSRLGGGDAADLAGAGVVALEGWGLLAGLFDTTAPVLGGVGELLGFGDGLGDVVATLEGGGVVVVVGLVGVGEAIGLLLGVGEEGVVAGRGGVRRGGGLAAAVGVGLGERVGAGLALGGGLLVVEGPSVVGPSSRLPTSA